MKRGGKKKGLDFRGKTGGLKKKEVGLGFQKKRGGPF